MNTAQPRRASFSRQIFLKYSNFSSACSRDPRGPGFQRMSTPLLRDLPARLLERPAVHVQLPSTRLGQLLPAHLGHHHGVPRVQRVPPEDLWPPPLRDLDEDWNGGGFSRVGDARPMPVHVPGA